MEGKTDSELLTLFLAHAIQHFEAELASLKRSVPLSEKPLREQLVNQHGDDDAWRGLASDSFIGMVETVYLLGSRP